ncbi:hypothetical protein VPNG_10339 [Cytospora leucostoma]|uniref:NADPH-dependent 1-acyldihydroxyacetone phosphate reductase n=1 Tax=Cytospora leucostoma TaxID=1230097 RepID=A0A423VAM3_9PEZI|nr:hypothetical protein VPNG_10339 [Cytospora leucostoma]
MPLKSVLVTGCSEGGIGAALALAVAKRGHHVFATARNTSKIPGELSALSNVTVLQLDITSASSVAEAAKAVASSGRGLNVLINNAGAGYATPILDLDVEKAQRLYDTNVWGPVRMIQAFADLLIASRGAIVNISTVGAVINTPWISAYASSKAALVNLSETLRLELSPFGVSVLTVLVGIVDSHFNANDTALNETGFKLPPDSRYAAIEDIIAGWASGESKPKGITAEQLAELLVGDLVGDGKSGLVWKGPNASAIRFATKWFPDSLMNHLMSQNQGLHELSEKVSKDR